MFSSNTPSIKEFMRNRMDTTRRNISQYWIQNSLGILVIAICLASCGCENSSISDAKPASENEEITAGEILSTVVSQYESAKNYQDNAVLYLTYRLNGRAIQEPNPWSSAWNRNGQYSCDLFNSKVRCDGESLSCYIFDIETGNVDNQHLLVEKQSFGYLFNDKIASHFISGTSELPLDELETVGKDQLITPVLGFVDPAVAPSWLKRPQSVEKSADDDSLGMDCYVLKLVEDGKDFLVWINQQSGMIEQVQYPLQYLDSKILASDDVTDLRFFVRFHDASLDKPVADSRFKIQDRIATKQVSNFVTLPEPIPCLKLGEEVGAVEFVNPDDAKPIAIKDIQSPATALLWLTGFSASDLVKKFGDVAASNIQKSYQFRVVYSDDLLKSPGGQSVEALDSLQTKLSDAKLSALYDAQMNTSSALEIKAVPSLIVIDDQNRVQFAKAIDSDDWAEQLQVAMNRVAKGEKVAKEMQAEYQRFLDDYHKQLVAATSSQSARQPTSFAGSKLPAMNRQARRQLNRRDVLWETGKLATPGNVHIPFGSSRTFVLDGWQTVVELDQHGAVQERYSLDVPSEVGINRIRSLKTSSGDWLFVAYSMLGKHAFVFDQNWNKKFELPNNSNVVSECQLVESTGEKVELWLSSLGRDGLQKFDLETGASEISIAKPVRGFCRFGRDLVHLEGDRLLTNQSVIGELSDWKITAVRHVPGRERCIAVGNKAGAWRLFCVTTGGKVAWSEQIAPQYFDNEIDPIGFVNLQGRTSVVLASGESSFSIFDIDNVNKRIFSTSSYATVARTFTGIGGKANLASQQRGGGNEVSMVVCDENAVRCFKLDLSGNQMIPAAVELNR